jgi:hypothetical protein
VSGGRIGSRWLARVFAPTMCRRWGEANVRCAYRRSGMWACAVILCGCATARGPAHQEGGIATPAPIVSATGVTPCEPEPPEQAGQAQEADEDPFLAELRRICGSAQLIRTSVSKRESRRSCDSPGPSSVSWVSDAESEHAKVTLATTDITKQRALELLKAQIAHTLGPRGCGIDWCARPKVSRDRAQREREAVFWGEVCNCSARIVYRESRIVRLTVSFAC